MKKRIKQICASFLAAIMVFTYMPVLGLSAVYADEPENTTEAVTAVVVSFEPFEVEYTGDYPDLSKVPQLEEVVTGDGGVLHRGVDYTVAAKYYLPGQHTVVFTGKGAYENVDITSNSEFTILSDATAEYKAYAEDTEYTGKVLEAGDVVVTVIKNGNTELNPGEYEVNLVEPEGATGAVGETYTVEVSVDDAVVDTTTTTVVKKDISENMEVAVADAGEYDNSAKEPAVTVSYKGKDFPETDYTVSYDNNINAGDEAKAIVVLDSENYTGTKEQDFSIDQYELKAGKTKANVTPILPQEYTGKVINPELAIKLYEKNEAGQDPLPEDDYEVVYSKSVNAGDYSVTITPSDNRNLTGSLIVENAYTIDQTSSTKSLSKK
jgi:hypothetical protein